MTPPIEPMIFTIETIRETMPVSLILPAAWAWIECIILGVLGGFGLSLLNNGQLERMSSTAEYVDLGFVASLFLGGLAGLLMAGLGYPSVYAILAGFVAAPLFKGLSEGLLKMVGAKKNGNDKT